VVETVVRGSRFRAWLGPVADAGSAARALDERAAAGPDATHHCSAYRVWRAGRTEEAGFDAGEPGGTAGRPILGALRHAGLVQASCVVSRWFGGVKLGTGGLGRAYGEAAEAAVDAARDSGALIAAEERTALRVGFEYPLSGAVQRVLARFHARERESAYGERVELELDVPAAAADAFERALVEATGAAAGIARLETRLEPR
jgi:putative IMPACT (imprinted ancient) family translation regulator